MSGQNEHSKKRRSLGVPGLMFGLAVIIPVTFGLLRILGAPQDFSGLFALAFGDPSAEMVYAGIYLLVYVSFVLLAPVFALAGIIFVFLQFIIRHLAKAGGNGLAETREIV